MSYKNDFPCLIALISHLATTSYKSGTISGISDRVGFSENDVRRVLESYREFFVEVPYSGKDDNSKLKYFTLHLKYGLRRGDTDDNKPLPPDYTSLLFDFIQTKIEIENEASVSNRQNKITLIAAVIAALAALAAAGIGLIQYWINSGQH